MFPAQSLDVGRQGRCIPCKKRRNHAEYQRRKARARPALSVPLMVHRPAAPALPSVTDLDPASRVATIHRLLTRSTRLPPEQTRVIAEQIAHTLERAQPHAADPGLCAAVERLGALAQTPGIDLSTLGNVLDSVMRELGRAERAAAARSRERLTAMLAPPPTGPATLRFGDGSPVTWGNALGKVFGALGHLAASAASSAWIERDDGDDDAPARGRLPAGPRERTVSIVFEAAEDRDEEGEHARPRFPSSAPAGQERLCRSCGTLFTTADGRIRYCSPDCREEGRLLGPRYRD